MKKIRGHFGVRMAPARIVSLPAGCAGSADTRIGAETISEEDNRIHFVLSLLGKPDTN